VHDTKVIGQAGARKSPQICWRSGFIGVVALAHEISDRATAVVLLQMSAGGFLVKRPSPRS
jgi:hypothetical protein